VAVGAPALRKDSGDTGHQSAEATLPGPCTEHSGGFRWTVLMPRLIQLRQMKKALQRLVLQNLLRNKHNQNMLLSPKQECKAG
jgi:hypothetical protein